MSWSTLTVYMPGYRDAVKLPSAVVTAVPLTAEPSWAVNRTLIPPMAWEMLPLTVRSTAMSSRDAVVAWVRAG